MTNHNNYVIIIIESEERTMDVFIVINVYTDEIKGVYTTCKKAQKWINQMAEKNDDTYKYNIKKYWAI